ncbi:MAG: tetratricopeptide repeat protein [Lachnospiraceae bacterium]|nr:tetratricopeptide repeat protein [Lachnospiraceae bacterium]MDD3659671.1 tetratricopeptide repeat protein [Lachnospiraceae bacterium]
MNCYHCGCRLSEKDFCTGCGADVSVYKKIIHISNSFYNIGLEKANVRDLSGAISSLRQSLKFNKNNIKARNLLGLVYFETGEAVAALSEWVISKNIRQEKNIADDYINAIQTNTARLDTINQTIKKYNQALSYCNQDSLDLAVIQLKKVLSMNPNFIRAHQLLALIYIYTREYEKARKELLKCTAIDANNTTTLRYLKEIDLVTSGAEDKETQQKVRKKESDEVIKYQSGNETIIQPLNVKEQTGVSSLFNIVIGLVIGLAAAWFLILPARISAEKADINKELIAVSEESDQKTTEIEELKRETESLTEAKSELETQLQSYVGADGTMKASDSLQKAVRMYLEDPTNLQAVGDVLMEIEEESVEASTSEEFSLLYQKIMELTGPNISTSYYNTGYTAYKQSDYTTAITNLEKAVRFDPANGEALFSLANSFNKNGDKEKAKDTYEKVIELFPGTEKASRSEVYLTEMDAS